MKKLLICVLSCLMVVMALGACASNAPAQSELVQEEIQSEQPAELAQQPLDDSTQASGETKSHKIGLVTPQLGHPGLTLLVQAVKDNVREGDELIIADANGDQAKQISDVEDMLQKGVEIMLIDAVDSRGVKAAFEACQKKGVPAIIYNTAVDESFAHLATGKVTVDNYACGYKSGEALAEVLGGKGKVIMYTFSTVIVCRDRGDGFKDAMKKYPDIEIILEEDGENSTEGAMKLMENWMQTYPDVDAVWANNTQPGTGVIAAIEAAGKAGQIKVALVDGLLQDFEAIKRGALQVAAVYPLHDLGREAMEMAYRVLEGQPAGDDPLLSSPIATIDNVDEYLDLYKK